MQARGVPAVRVCHFSSPPQLRLPCVDQVKVWEFVDVDGSRELQSLVWRGEGLPPGAVGCPGWYVSGIHVRAAERGAMLKA